MKTFFKKMWLYFVYLLLVLADGALTFYNTPDLSEEGNPLVAKLGLGWTALAVSNLTVLILLFLVCRYSFTKYKTVMVPSKNCREYYSILCFGRPDWFWQTWYKWPKYWGWFPAVMGFSGIFGLTAGRLVTVLEWVAVTLDVDTEAYFRFRRALPLHRVDVWVVVIVVTVMFMVWVRRERQIAEQALKGGYTS